MQKISKTMFFVCLLFLVSMPVLATPIISISGFADSSTFIDDFQAAAVAWSQVDAFSNVNISIDFEDILFYADPGTYSAYLMNSIGTGTTDADEIASTTFSAGADLSTIMLFSGLTLDPGSYFLVIALDPALNPPFASAGGWGSTSTPTISTTLGGIDAGQYFASTLASYLPASDFVFDGSINPIDPDATPGPRLLYDVQVPEPSTLLLMTFGSVFGLLALGFKRI